MKEKGFTLVELLAVIVILGLLALIATPAITGLIKSSKSDLSDSQLKSMVLSAKNWASDIENVDKLPDSENSICVTLKTLQQGGYADLDLKNPKNGKEYDNTKYGVKITKEGKNLVYEAGDLDIIKCNGNSI